MTRIRLPAYRKATESPPLAPVLESLVQHEVGGGWSVGWADTELDFPSKEFATQVHRLRRSRHQRKWLNR